MGPQTEVGIMAAINDFIPGGIENIFNVGLGVGAILAVGTVIYAGILYSSAGDNPSKQKNAREWIWAAVKGLALIAFGFVIISVANPEILEFREINIPKLSFNDPTPLPYYTPYLSLDAAGMIAPISGASSISSVYGMRVHPISNQCLPHRGVDFAVNCGAPVRAAKDGIFYKNTSSKTAGFGWYAFIKHTDGSITYYAHLNEFPSGLSSGDSVSKGEVIGYVGSTGQSTGCHLHFEARKLNPETGIIEAVNINPLFSLSIRQAEQELACING